MFIFLGTDDMVKVARKIGLWINKVSRSDTWQAIQKTASELKTLPRKFIQEADLDQSAKEIKQELETMIGNVDQEISEQIKPTKNLLDLEKDHEPEMKTQKIKKDKI